MTLHLINKDPRSSSALEDCLDVLAGSQSRQALLLIEDAVYAVLPDSANEAIHEKLKALPCPCYVLQEDLDPRGLADRVPAFFRVADYAAFVELSLDHAKVQSWS